MINKEAKHILNYILHKANCEFSKYVGGTLFVNTLGLKFNAMNLAVGSYLHSNDFHAMNAGTDPKAKDMNIVKDMFARSLRGETIAARKGCIECFLLQPFTPYEKIAVEAELLFSTN